MDALVLPLNYNPTGEYIFPCIIELPKKIADSSAMYAMYYAPHEPPGGICVAFSNSLDSPFVEYNNNPIISNTLPDGKVSHVSSPHVIWDEPTQQFYLYFHGENTTTRVARSSDGFNFTDETRILESTFVPGLTEASYARVFEYSLPDRGNRYIMLYMGNDQGTRRIYYGWSPNGWDEWQFSPNPLVNPEPDQLLNISGPMLMIRNDMTYVAYHGNDGTMRITEIGNDFDRENHLGVFYRPASTDYGRAASPWFITADGVDYMFYEAGPRLNARICVASACARQIVAPEKPRKASHRNAL
ncbi:hypothetical protein KWH19_06510 [Xanthomonas campestris pv. pennamericanum]|nr:hypothetical protein [Xanthomonas campestris pv. pennamericanum]